MQSCPLFSALVVIRKNLQCVDIILIRLTQHGKNLFLRLLRVLH